MGASDTKGRSEKSVRYIVTGAFETVRPEVALNAATTGEEPTGATYTVELVPDPSDESFANGTVIRLGFKDPHPFKMGRRVTLTVSLD